MAGTFSQIYVQIVFAVKNRNALRHNFQWQEGFGAFSYSHSALDKVIQYIQNQKEQHKKKPFKEEYLSFLKKFDVEFKDEYLFEWIEKNE
jgi:nicotinic acid phosphoribosyltransferase